MKKKEYNKYYRKYGHPPKRKCKVCDVDIGKNKVYCSKHPSISKRNRLKQRFCKECDVEVGKGKSFCGDCGRKRGNSRKYPICGYDGCKKERVYMKKSCLYHTEEKRYERHMNSLIFCKDCNGEIGKRKDVKNRSLCDECKKKNKEVSNIKQRKYRNEYYKNRYNTDEEYRKKIRDYQNKRNQMIKEVK